MFPRVKDVISAAEKGGIENLKQYFNQDGMIIDPLTWSGKIFKLLNENKIISVKAEIELLIEKFNFYKYVSEEKTNRDNTGTIDGVGYQED